MIKNTRHIYNCYLFIKNYGYLTQSMLLINYNRKIYNEKLFKNFTTYIQLSFNNIVFY